MGLVKIPHNVTRKGILQRIKSLVNTLSGSTATSTNIVAPLETKNTKDYLAELDSRRNNAYCLYRNLEHLK